LLLERSPRLGGRACSFTDPLSGAVIDNGQHLFMRCYRHTISFLEKINSLDKLDFQRRPRVEFLDREHGFTSFDCPPLPAPAHIIAGLLRMKGIRLADKLGAARIGRAINSNGSTLEKKSVSEWLDSHGQSPALKERFWHPLVVATLNEEPRIASARMLRAVLREAFSDSGAASIGLANVGLGELYTDSARDFIRSRGGEVRTGCAARRFLIEQGRVISVELRGGGQIAADYFISAIPPNRLLELVPGELAEGELAKLARLKSSPIVSINLWFDRPLMSREFVGMIGTRSHWLFNRDLILKQGKESNHLAVVISAAREFTSWSKQRLVEMAVDEINELIPSSRAAVLTRSLVVKEREATISHTVESDLLRPGARTSIENLLLAGDWTDTGLPATIESAVISGHTAAGIICTLEADKVQSSRRERA
jgi:zeta-carotene desaturase